MKCIDTVNTLYYSEGDKFGIGVNPPTLSEVAKKLIVELIDKHQEENFIILKSKK